MVVLLCEWWADYINEYIAKQTGSKTKKIANLELRYSNDEQLNYQSSN